MDKKYWPIQPTFISYCPLVGQRSEHLKYPNIEGVFKVDELRGFLADASDDKDINNPLSLFQVVPDYFRIDDENKRIKGIKSTDSFINDILGDRQIVRIDPGKLYSNFHCCDLFRLCNNGKNEALCYDSDSRIALLYHQALLSINIETDFNQYFSVLNKIINDYNEYKGFEEEALKLKVETYFNEHVEKRFFITYTCKYSQLEEYFFPVVYAGRIVAVLMQGQRFSEGLQREDLFNGYIEEGYHGGKLQRSIKHLSKKYFEEPPMSYNRLIAITNRIERLEEKIKVELEAASQSYINEKFSGWQKEFRNKIKEIDSESDDALLKYNKYLSQILNEIFHEFHDKGFIRIYTLRPLPENDDMDDKYKFELIGDSSCSSSPQYEFLYFSSFPIKKDAIEKDELLSYIKSPPTGFDKERDIFRMEVPIMSQKAYIIWKHYDYTYSGAQKNHEDYYNTSLKSLYPTLLEPFFILEGDQLEKKLETSMRISVHESAQVIPSVINAINSPDSLEILEKGGEYNGSPTITKPMHKILDVSNRLLLLEGLFKRSTLIFKKNPPKYQWCDLHRIIYSTRSMFDSTIMRKNMQSLQIISEGSFSKYRLYTDYAYLSHVLFNLVDNAMKYGLKGSNIYIKVKVEFDPLIKNIFNKDEVRMLKISVVSFGNEISEDIMKDIFKLYFRHSSNEIEGMGIGLFLVKKICNSLQYQVECKKSRRQSTINLPLYYCYRLQNEVEQSDLPEYHKSILKRSMSRDAIDYMVNYDAGRKWEVTEEEVKSLLVKTVYRNEFEISIPTKMDQDIKIV